MTKKNQWPQDSRNHSLLLAISGRKQESSTEECSVYKKLSSAGSKDREDERHANSRKNRGRKKEGKKLMAKAEADHRGGTRKQRFGTREQPGPKGGGRSQSQNTTQEPSQSATWQRIKIKNTAWSMNEVLLNSTSWGDSRVSYSHTEHSSHLMATERTGWAVAKPAKVTAGSQMNSSPPNAQAKEEV